MPKLGGKIWFTAIAGLLMGFVLFGMLQRGCDAQGQATVATTDHNEPKSRETYAATRNNARTPGPTARNNNANSAKARRSRARSKARKNNRNSSRPTTINRDRSALERNARSRSRADSARKAELARLTRERTQRYRDRSARARAGDPNTLDPVLRTNTTGASVENAVAQAAAQTGAELRAQRGEGGSGSGRNRDDAGGSGGNGDSGSGDRGADASDEAAADDPFADLAAQLADLGIDQSFVDLIRQVVTNGAPPTNPFTDTNTNPDDGATPDDGASIPVDPSPETPIDLTTPVLARWVPVDHTGCSTLDNQGLETRDLFLAFLDRPIAPPVVSSTEENSIVILDGTFYQDPFGTNGPPGVAVDDCIQFDSYLTIGRANPTFLSAPNPADWGSRLLAEWFAIFGAEITQDRATFGDDRYYIHVGRFTSNADAKIFGKLRVDYAGLLAIVDVPDWLGADTGGLDNSIPPVLPKVAMVGFTSTGVLGGSVIQGTVSIDRPAPAGGQLISLSTDKPDRVSIPTQVVIPEGEFVASFEVATLATGIVENAVITASTSDSSASGTLAITAPSLVGFEALRTRLLDGQTTSAVIRLGTGADPAGTTVTISVDKNDAVSVPTTVRIPAGQRRSVITITALDVTSTEQVAISATAGGVTQSIGIEVVPTVTIVDANSDGVVDTADLGSLIAAFGSDNMLLDFNSDGVIDTADLGLLTSRFGETHGDGVDGPGDTPGGGSEDAVIARWVDIPQDGCGDYPGTRTAALYLGFLDEPGAPVITSGTSDQGVHAITVSNGVFIQHPLGSNDPPREVVTDVFPCARYDSFLSVGDDAPIFPLGAPNPLDWGTTLNAIWISFGATSLQDPGRFGDNRHYIRIGQFTASSSAIISGAVRIDFAGELAIAQVPDWTTITARALDLNFDGQVDSTDVGIVIRAYGTSNPAYDFDGDGTIGGDDLRPLLDMIQSNPGL